MTSRALWGCPPITPRVSAALRAPSHSNFVSLAHSQLEPLRVCSVGELRAAAAVEDHEQHWQAQPQANAKPQAQGLRPNGGGGGGSASVGAGAAAASITNDCNARGAGEDNDKNIAQRPGKVSAGRASRNCRHGSGAAAAH
jgi:hypothetical protein